jgi:stress response protein YsnF
MFRQASKESEQSNLAEQLKKQYEGPEQKIKQYQELLRAGKIDQKTFDSAVAGLQQGQGGTRYAAAAERGSREAYSILMNSRKDDGTKKLVTIAGKQLAETQGLRRDIKQEKVSIPAP